MYHDISNFHLFNIILCQGVRPQGLRGREFWQFYQLFQVIDNSISFDELSTEESEASTNHTQFVSSHARVTSFMSQQRQWLTETDKERHWSDWGPIKNIQSCKKLPADLGFHCSSQPSMVHWLSSPIFPFCRPSVPLWWHPTKSPLLHPLDPQTHTFSESLW